MRLERSLLVISCVLATAGCPGGGGGDGSGGGAGGSSGFLGDNFGGVSGAAGASGASGSTGSGNVSTGLPPTKVLGELTEAEAQTLCTRLAQSARDALSEDDFERFSCTLAALGTSLSTGPNNTAVLDHMACQESVSSCLATAGETTSEDNCGDSDLAQTLTDCDATASELEACLRDSIAVVRRLISALDCNSTVDELMSTGGFEEPASCNSLDMKCPGVLSEIGDSTEVLPQMDGTGGSGVAGAGGNEGPGGCSDTCRDAMDGWCDDGGDSSMTDICELGTDCTDCGARP